jgi:tetratricopeptide (TPR) repeat protein
LGPIVLFSVVFVGGLYKRRLFLALLAAGILTALCHATHRQIGMWKDSVSLWVNVLSIEPRNASFVYGGLAEANKDVGLLYFANSEVDLALKMDPENPDYHALRGEILLKQAHVDEAIPYFKKSISLNQAASFDPMGYYPHRFLALAYIQKGMYPEALAESREAIRMKPYESEAYHVLGLAYAGQKQYANSIEAFQKALSLEPYHYNPDILRNLTAVCMDSVKNKRFKSKTAARKRELLSPSTPLVNSRSRR